MTKKIIYIIYTLILWGTTLGFAQGAKGNGGDQTTATRLLQAGDKFYDQRLYTASMKSYLDGLRIAEHQGYSELTARFYNGMGNLYSTQGDYQMGLYFYRKALSSSRKTGQKTLQNAVLNNLVGASCFVGQADSGMVFLQQMEANVEHNSGYRYNILMGRGLVAKSQDQPAAAASYYIQARQYAIRAGMDSSFVDNTNSCLAQLYMDTHRLDSAILLLKKNEEWARRTNHDEFLAETMHLLAQAYDAQGDATRASTMHDVIDHIEKDLMEKLHYSDELNAMKNTQYIYDANKNASTINLLTQQQIFDNQQIRTQARWLLALAIALALIIVLFIIVSAQKRQLHHAYNRLYDRSQLFLASPIQAKEAPQAANKGDHLEAHQGGNLESNQEDKQRDDQGDGQGDVQRDDQEEKTQEAAPRSLILTTEQRAALLADIGRVMGKVEEFCSTDFSIDRLAQLVGSNPRYVSEAINEGYGKNFRSFLNDYRIKEAMQRLADNDRYGHYTIKAISESVGYKSQANFINIFTRLTGMKPSIYQKISTVPSEKGWRPSFLSLPLRP